MVAQHVDGLIEAVALRNERNRKDLTIGHWWTMFACSCGGWWVLRDDVVVKDLRCPKNTSS